MQCQLDMHDLHIVQKVIIIELENEGVNLWVQDSRALTMNDMLTAKDMQDLLQVDRSTIYRMAEAGRIPALKVGRQWRFPKEKVDNWLRNQSNVREVQSMAGDGLGRSLAHLLPLECVQMIQDVFAGVLDVMMVVTDMQGRPVTELSRPVDLFRVASEIPYAVQQCARDWAGLGRAIPLEPRFEVGPLGLLCARGLIRIDTELAGMVLVGGIAPAAWPPEEDQVRDMADHLGVGENVVLAHINDVYFKDKTERDRILTFVQPIADVIAHIVDERTALMEKLEAIAQLTR